MNLLEQLKTDRETLNLQAERVQDPSARAWIDRAKGFVDGCIAMAESLRPTHTDLSTAELGDLHFVERLAADCRYAINQLRPCA